MTDAEKLNLLAAWLDKEQAAGRWPDTLTPVEAQTDLRRMAASLESREALRKLALKIAAERNALADALRRVRPLLLNLVAEQAGWRRFFGRWAISDEPLRGDAMNVLIVVQAAMKDRDEMDAHAAELQKYADVLTPEDRAALEALPSAVDRLFGGKA